MPLRDPAAAGPLDAPLAVVLLVRDADGAARCLRSVLPTLGPDVPLLAGGGAGAREVLAQLLGEAEATWLGADGAAAWNAAAALAPGADLVLLDSATEVGPGWLEDLRGAAAAEPDAATLTALSNDAAFLSVPRRNLPWPLLPPELTAASAAELAREGALRLRPRTPTALPHCALVRRAALQLVGGFDEALAPREALAELCARATAAGLAHVVADELLVVHRGAPGAHPPDRWPGEAAERHPALEPAVSEAADARHSALARALLAVSVALEPLQVTIDARSLAGGVTGTTVHVVELLGALTERADVRVRALLPERPGDDAARAIAAMPALERLDAAAPEIRRSHVVHRPWQIESVQEMADLDRFGERTVVTHQDLIGYRTPPVFAGPREWQDYRRATASALGLAAMVLFFSPAAMADALADDLVDGERARVVPLGAQARHLHVSAEPAMPAGMAGRERPFLLVLGNRFRHKNVRFALELLGALREREGWEGELVIAGAEVLHGSGSGDDAAWLLGHPAHAAHVTELGAVGQREKAWLLERAAAVVYPSTYEGFGLVPFEAAAAGTPCLVAPVSALRDTVPAELALLEPWDAVTSAARVAGVLREGAARDELVAGLRAAAAGLTWEATAEAVVAAYRDALRLPAPSGAPLTAALARAEHDYWAVRDGIPDEAWPLVRPDAPLVDPPLGRELSAALQTPGGRERLLAALRPGVAARVARRLRG